MKKTLHIGELLVTPAGGSQPLWARDGRTMFYTALDRGCFRGWLA
jgi:hypothetical protein